jgi:hypothetical protein
MSTVMHILEWLDNALTPKVHSVAVISSSQHAAHVDTALHHCAYCLHCMSSGILLVVLHNCYDISTVRCIIMRVLNKACTIA